MNISSISYNFLIIDVQMILCYYYFNYHHTGETNLCFMDIKKKIKRDRVLYLMYKTQSLKYLTMKTILNFQI